MNNIREDIDKIKQLNEHFINEELIIMERLGVGDNVVETAKEIFGQLLGKVGKEHISRLTLNDEAEQRIPIYGPFSIGKESLNSWLKTFKDIDVIVKYFKAKSTPKIVFAGASIPVETKHKRDAENKYKAYFRSIDPCITLIFAGPNQSVTLFELKELLEREQTVITGTIAHELMHLLEKDNFIKNRRGKSLYDMVNYQIYSDVRTGLGPFDELIFLLYYGDKVEQITRPTELLTYLNTNNVTKKNFQEEVKKTKMYENFVNMKNLTFDGFMTTLKTKYADKINNLTVEKDSQEYYDKASIDDKILFLLTHITKSFQRLGTQKLNQLLFFDTTFGGAARDIEKYWKGFGKTGEAVKTFWINKIRNLNRVGDKQLRKLFKLYDMMPDEPQTTDNSNDGQNVTPNDTQSNSISSIQEWELNMEIRKIKKIFS